MRLVTPLRRSGRRATAHRVDGARRRRRARGGGRDARGDGLPGGPPGV